MKIGGRRTKQGRHAQRQGVIITIICVYWNLDDDYKTFKTEGIQLQY